MRRKTYSDEFKEQVIQECYEVGNIAVVARRHDLSKSIVYTWMNKKKKHGSTKALSKDKDKRLKELNDRLESATKENDQLKKIVAEKELELTILRDLRDRVNPQ